MEILDTRSRPLRALRISVTDRCNFRCTYCMPREVFPPDYPFLDRGMILSFEEIERLAGVFASLGVNKLRLTGGEPLLRKGLPALVAKLIRIPGIEDLALTTNGALLDGLAGPLKNAGLRRLTVSLDTLDEARFKQFCDTEIPLARVLEGLEAAQKMGFGPIKLNCVLQRGVNEDEIVPLARYAKDRGHILRFIEFMDVGTQNGWKLDSVVPAIQVLARIRSTWDLEPIDDPPQGRVASRWRYKDGGGEFGIVASVTEPFCAGCDRARLSSEGRLYTCLFAGEGTDLKTALRSGASDGDLKAIINNVWKRREDRYSELRSAQTVGRQKVEMFHIGG